MVLEGACSGSQESDSDVSPVSHNNDWPDKISLREQQWPERYGSKRTL